MIKQTGKPREFKTGAHRDSNEEKGRCDLLPLDIISGLFNMDQSSILKLICKFQEENNITCLYDVLYKFSNERYNGEYINSSFEASADMLLDVAKHFEEGAKKYGENNWKKGMPVQCYIDSAIRHYLKVIRGDTDECHDRAFVWNIICAIWTFQNHPELNSYIKLGETND